MQSRSWIRWTGLAVLALGLVGAGGCSSMGYKLGSMLPEDIKTVYVPTFINKTGEPMLEVIMTRAAITQIQRDGSLKIARTAEEADATLHVTLLNYRLQPLDFQRTVTTAATEYRAYVEARVVLIRRTTNQVVAEQPRVQGRATFPMTGDLTTSKQTANPPLSEDLAKRIVETVAEAWQ